MIHKKLTAILCASLLVAGGLLAGCSSSTSPAPSGVASGSPAASASGQKIEMSGSTSVQPLAEALAMAYNTKTGTVVNVNGGGSSVGISDVESGLSDIGNCSRDLKAEETSQGIVGTTVALDGLSIVVNPNNPVTNLTKDQITKIFKGEITNWKDVGGNDAEIIVFTREASSGTRGAFLELLKLEEGDQSLVTTKALEANSNGSMKTNVGTKDAAIGYVSMGSVDDTLKALSVDGVAATVENVKNQTYGLYRPFLMCTKGEASGAAKAFLDFALSEEGQQIVSEDYITVK